MSRNHDSLFGNVVLPDKLSPEELNKLVDMTIHGNFGTCDERSNLLGAWYDTVQSLVNYKLSHRYKHYNAVNRLWNKLTFVPKRVR